MSILKCTVIFIFGISFQAPAADLRQAMVTSLTGTVEIFTPAKADQAGSMVIFEGQRFKNRRAQVGAKIYSGDILRTGNDGKLKIIYDNGDVFILSAASAFSVPKQSEDGKTTKGEIVYGKIRGMIEKGGPLSGVQLRTKTVVAGVRGTDLFVAYNPGGNSSEVHVLRGEVALKKVEAPVAAGQKKIEEKVVLINTGQKAVVRTAVDSDLKIEVKQSTRQELEVIQQSTVLPKVSLQKATEEQKIEINKLEQKASTKILEDIKTTTPEVYKIIVSKKLETTDQINQAVVQDLSKVAPKGAGKPKQSDFETKDDIYQQFFKPASQ